MNLKKKNLHNNRPYRGIRIHIRFGWRRCRGLLTIIVILLIELFYGEMVLLTFKEDKKLAGRSMISSKLNFARYVSCVILRSRVLGVYMTCAAVLYCCAEGNKI